MSLQVGIMIVRLVSVKLSTTNFYYKNLSQKKLNGTVHYGSQRKLNIPLFMNRSMGTEPRTRSVELLQRSLSDKV